MIFFEGLDQGVVVFVCLFAFCCGLCFFEEQVVNFHLDCYFVSQRRELEVPLSSEKSVFTYFWNRNPVSLAISHSVSIASGCLQGAAATPFFTGLINVVDLERATECCFLEWLFSKQLQWRRRNISHLARF